MSRTRPAGPPVGRVPPRGGHVPSRGAVPPGDVTMSGTSVPPGDDAPSGGRLPRDGRRRAGGRRRTGRSRGDVPVVGLRLAAAAGAAAVAVGSWLALQPAQFAAADAGVVPGSSPTAAAGGGEGTERTGVPGAAQPGSGTRGAGAAAPPAGTPAGTSAPITEPGATTAPPAPAPAVAPVRLEVQGRAAPVEVVPVGVEPTGALVVPDDPDVLGWWQSGPGVGAPAGSTVLVGHLDVPGDLGVMRALAVLPVDTPVTLVDGQGGTATYRVAARRTFSKDDGLPTDLFRTDGAPQLVLVTCGGAFDARTGHYADNVVVYAVPA
ncbi:class F sortase [Cellulomonas sp. NS3]|uniref:class F sortase n=1 Tax=Cellulomonas sp. NS3 TaxID=2973977 RepID=UPI0021633DFC|nr:class F sortase [Cellulomonas sp. NS3]